jgi:hypothetical protein
MIISFDPKCWELAEHFLSDEPNFKAEIYKRSLAIAIQRAIEDEIQMFRSEAGEDKQP